MKDPTEATKLEKTQRLGQSELTSLVSRFGVTGWADLLKIAEEVNAPEKQPSDSPKWCADVSFDHPTGWKVVIFYDCGELDYIDHFVTPDGTDIEFWDLPEDDTWKNYLINWRGVGDLERLLAC